METNPSIRIDIVPMGAVRQVRSDTWNPRPAVARYRAFRDELRLKLPGSYMLPAKLPKIVFWLPMPKSWSQKKRDQTLGLPHQQKPDLDNLIKAFKDAVAKEDSHVWSYAGAEKRWGVDGAIDLYDTPYRKTR